MDFSSQICSGLLFRAHTSYQSLGVLEWPTDISLTEGLMSGASMVTTTTILPRQFQHISKTTSGGIAARPAVSYHQLFVGRGKELQIGPWPRRDGPTDGGFSPLPRWASDTQGPVFFFCPGRPTHPINTGIMLKCTLTHLPPYLSSSLSFSHFGTC